MKLFNASKKYAARISVAAVGLFGAGAALAAPPDFTSLTDAVDFSTVASALLLVAAALAGVYVLWKGASMIIAALRGR